MPRPHGGPLPATCARTRQRARTGAPLAAVEPRATPAPSHAAQPAGRQVLWTFSIYLEAVAIFPQLIVLQRFGEVENLTSNYVFFLGAYRGLYIMNWIYRCSTEPNYSHWIVWIAGAVQSALYADFFYYYALRCAGSGPLARCTTPSPPRTPTTASGTTSALRFRSSVGMGPWPAPQHNTFQSPRFPSSPIPPRSPPGSPQPHS